MPEICRDPCHTTWNCYNFITTKRPETRPSKQKERPCLVKISGPESGEGERVAYCVEEREREKERKKNINENSIFFFISREGNQNWKRKI